MSRVDYEELGANCLKVDVPKGFIGTFKAEKADATISVDSQFLNPGQLKTNLCFPVGKLELEIPKDGGQLNFVLKPDLSMFHSTLAICKSGEFDFGFSHQIYSIPFKFGYKSKEALCDITVNPKFSYKGIDFVTDFNLKDQKLSGYVAATVKDLTLRIHHDANKSLIRSGAFYTLPAIKTLEKTSVGIASNYDYKVKETQDLTLYIRSGLKGFNFAYMQQIVGEQTKTVRFDYACSCGSKFGGFVSKKKEISYGAGTSLCLKKYGSVALAFDLNNNKASVAYNLPQCCPCSKITVGAEVSGQKVFNIMDICKAAKIGLKISVEPKTE